MFRSRGGLILSRHHDALGLTTSRALSQEEIKAAFRAKAKIHHPDTGGNADSFKTICSAYEVLSGKRDDSHIRGSDFYDHPHSPKTCNRDAWMREERTRDGETAKGSDHGMHTGAAWANQSGPKANYSTRDFYRPYTPGNGSSGFTEEELHEAKTQTRHYIFYRVGKKLLIGALVWYAIYSYYLEDRINMALEAQKTPEGIEAYLEMRANDLKTGKNEPYITPYFERKQREVEAQMQANEERRKELGLSNSLQSDPQAGKAMAVSYRGRPFTPEGLAAARRERKGGMVPVPPPINVDDDIECDMDD